MPMVETEVQSPDPETPREPIDQESLVSLVVELTYDCGGVRHAERRLMPRVNLWRDSLPKGLDTALIGMQAGEAVELAFAAGQFVPGPRADLVCPVRLSDFDGMFVRGFHLHPDEGRFLPRGVLHRASLAGIFRDNMKPFRVRDTQTDRFIADLNHPLAGLPVSLRAEVVAVGHKDGDRGGRCVDLIEELTAGAGMACRVAHRPTAFFERDWAARLVEEDDAVFYAQPRYIAHVDAHAIETIEGLYARLLQGRTRVLDLMSADRSHLGRTAGLRHVAGLGLNASELSANAALAERVVHDLNATPGLPFADGGFDAVVCTVSVEYLTRPFEVFEEVARVLVPGGVFILTFSNRWFPPKVLKVWSAAHPYERLGLVLEYFMRTGRFEQLGTLVVSGFPRPEDDRHIAETSDADPVFAVWGRVKA